MSRCPGSPLWGEALGSLWEHPAPLQGQMPQMPAGPSGCHIRASTGTRLSVQILPGDSGQGSVPEGLAPVCAQCGCRAPKGAGVGRGDGRWHLPGKTWTHRLGARPSAVCLNPWSSWSLSTALTGRQSLSLSSKEAAKLQFLEPRLHTGTTGTNKGAFEGEATG